MTGPSPYRPAEDRLITDACSRSGAERIRDLAAELGRSESAVRRRWERLAREMGPDPVPGRDPWNAIVDAAAVGCGLRLDPDDVARLAADDAIALEPTDRTLEAFELRDGEWVLIGCAKDDEAVSIRPFDAITFSLGDLWP